MKIFKDNYIVGQVLNIDIKKIQLKEFMYGKDGCYGYQIVEYEDNIHDKKNQQLLIFSQVSQALQVIKLVSDYRPILPPLYIPPPLSFYNNIWHDQTMSFSKIDNSKKFIKFNILLTPINKLEDEFDYDILVHYNKTTDYSTIYVGDINILSPFDIPYENEKKIYHYIRSILRVKHVFLKDELKDTKFIKEQINEFKKILFDEKKFFENYKCPEWRSTCIKEQHNKIFQMIWKYLSFLQNNEI